MKIAIQGHPTRGKEVIQILENLGGKNKLEFIGGSNISYYFINKDKNIDMFSKYNITDDYKLYMLEEFEKEFPFKIGDSVVFKNATNNPRVYIVSELVYYDNQFLYKLKDIPYHYLPSVLKLHTSMKERNVTLTLEKAKEWYNKGGELKEIALQAFTEKELNPFPKSWEEYCKMYKVPTNIFGPCAPIRYIALWKLEQLRDCYRQGWEPDWTSDYADKYCITISSYKPLITPRAIAVKFLAFQSQEVAEEFLKNFERLIKEAGDLI